MLWWKRLFIINSRTTWESARTNLMPFPGYIFAPLKRQSSVLKIHQNYIKLQPHLIKIKFLFMKWHQMLIKQLCHHNIYTSWIHRHISIYTCSYLRVYKDNIRKECKFNVILRERRIRWFTWEPWSPVLTLLIDLQRLLRVLKEKT